MSHRRVDGRGRYGNEVGNSLEGRERDEPMRREGLQARGIYKEVPKDPLQQASCWSWRVAYYDGVDVIVLYGSAVPASCCVRHDVLQRLLWCCYSSTLLLASYYARHDVLQRLLWRYCSKVPALIVRVIMFYDGCFSVIIAVRCKRLVMHVTMFYDGCFGLVLSSSFVL